jgi:hypothetical protein
MRRLAPAALLALPFLPAAKAQGPEIFPLAQVHPGLKGYGLTVFNGMKPEKFDFEVVGVAHDMMPKMDIIIVKSDDPKLQESGFAHGMSGSPLYVDGKVLCAFAYAWKFNDKPIGGCTPIEYMVAESKHVARGPDHTALASNDEFKRYVQDAADQPPDSWIARTLPERPAATDDSQMVRAAVPLAISGLGASAFAQAKSVFEPYGIEPMQGGGEAADSDKGPGKFEMGGSLGVELADGDYNMASIGTVSYVDDNTILAFGHPFMGLGESYLPVTGAEVHTIIPSKEAAFKLASSLKPIGSLVQDRPSGIVADQGKQAEMIPVDIKVHTAEGDKVSHTNVIRHRFLTPQLTLIALQSAVSTLVPDITDATITIQSELKLKGYDPINFTDYIYSNEGFSANQIGNLRVLRVLVPLLFNPFSPVKIEHVSVDASVVYKADYSEIDAIRLPQAELPYGAPTYVDVLLKPYSGEAYTQRIPITIPERLAGSTLKLDVVPGDQAKPDVAQPQSVDDIMAAIKKTFPANMMVVTVYTPDEGIAVDGRIIPDLPLSALDTARPGANTHRGDSYKAVFRAVVPSRQVVIGRQELAIKVQDRHQ